MSTFGSFNDHCGAILLKKLIVSQKNCKIIQSELNTCMIHKFLTFSLWAGSAPWARRSSTTARCPPAQARDRTVWSFVEVARFTSAPTQYTYSYKQLIKLYILNHSIWLFILESPSKHYLCWSEIAQYRDIQPWQLSSEEFGHLLIHAPANNIYIIRFDECMLIKWKKNSLISKFLYER